MSIVCLALLLPAAGCGPIESTAVIGEAEVELAGARAAEADRHAPYEFTSAELYLEKAREERGFADYQIAIDYARKAAELARQARARAMGKTREDSKSPPAPEGTTPLGEEEEAGTPPPVIEEVEP